MKLGLAFQLAKGVDTAEVTVSLPVIERRSLDASRRWYTFDDRVHNLAHRSQEELRTYFRLAYIYVFGKEMGKQSLADDVAKYQENHVVPLYCKQYMEKT